MCRETNYFFWLRVHDVLHAIHRNLLTPTVISFPNLAQQACFEFRKLGWPRIARERVRCLSELRRSVILFAMHSPRFANAMQRQTDRLWSRVT